MTRTPRALCLLICTTATACSPDPQRVAVLHDSATIKCYVADLPNRAEQITHDLDSNYKQNEAWRVHTVDSVRGALYANCAIAKKKLEHYLDRGW